MDMITLIIQDTPYGTEKPWNALRLAQALMTAEETRLNIFLLGDGVGMAKLGQEVPAGYYNLGKMLEQLIAKGVDVQACGTCCKVRGLKTENLIHGVVIGVMADLARWVKESKQVMTF
ncbi:MAG: DsrE family protein [Nitrospirae bacterium]|nr:DsrE family protein [Nitrospirota bacterium]MBI3353017.1 DsrE family protein [Nitrospirota bacterium]